MTPRVISLLASGTEIVCALGAGDTLVGRSHECDNPEWVRTLPACTRPTFDPALPSGEIDALVKRRLRTGEPLYDVDTALIRTLAPDLLITQTHCEVCAVTPADVERAGGGNAAQVLGLSAGTLDGIYQGITRVAAALERREAGTRLIDRMQDRIRTIRDSVRDCPTPTVVMLEWVVPLFSMGNWGPELLTAANGRPLLGGVGQYSSVVTWEDIRAANPDFLIVAPCGFDLERTRQEVPTLEAFPGWFDLGAVRHGKVVLADGNRYFNRSGTTVVETVEILAEVLHGHHAAAAERAVGRWEPYNSSRKT